jgi:hypothetical protein
MQVKVRYSSTGYTFTAETSVNKDFGTVATNGTLSQVRLNDDGTCTGIIFHRVHGVMLESGVIGTWAPFYAGRTSNV